MQQCSQKHESTVTGSDEVANLTLPQRHFPEYGAGMFSDDAELRKWLGEEYFLYVKHSLHHLTVL